MDSKVKATIINAAWQGWYHKGSDRLRTSLIHHGWSHDIHVWKDKPINEYFEIAHPYTIKAAALAEAIRMGYTHILWLDSSVWCIQNASKIMDIINDEGGYFWLSGFNLAQTATDNDLRFAEWSRDHAETLPELASSMFGINILSEKGKLFSEYFLDASTWGVFNSSRNHDNQSEDPRFLFGRQDQVAATIAYHKAGFTNARTPEVISSYYEPFKEFNKSVLFVMQGM